MMTRPNDDSETESEQRFAKSPWLLPGGLLILALTVTFYAGTAWDRVTTAKDYGPEILILENRTATLAANQTIVMQQLDMMMQRGGPALRALQDKVNDLQEMLKEHIANSHDRGGGK